MTPTTAQAILDYVKKFNVPAKPSVDESEGVIKVWLRAIGWVQDRWGNYLEPSDPNTRYHFKKTQLNKQSKNSQGDWSNEDYNPSIDVALSLIVSAAAVAGDQESVQKYSKSRVKRKVEKKARADTEQDKRDQKQAYALALKEYAVQRRGFVKKMLLSTATEAEILKAREEFVPLRAKWLAAVKAGTVPENDQQFATADSPPIIPVLGNEKYVWTETVDGVDYTVHVNTAETNVAEISIGAPEGNLGTSALTHGIRQIDPDDVGDSYISGKVYLGDKKDFGAALFMITSASKQKGAGTRALSIWCRMMAGYGIKLWIAQAVGPEGLAFLQALERKGKIKIQAQRGANLVVECLDAKPNPYVPHDDYEKFEPARISHVTDYEQHDIKGHKEAMARAGWIRRPLKVGERALLSYSNGWEGWVTVVKVFKNKNYRVRYDDTPHKTDSAWEYVLFVQEGKRNPDVRVIVGFRWSSPQGVREITDLQTDPRSGEQVFFVTTGGGPSAQIIPTREIESEIRRDEANYLSRTRAKGEQEAQQASQATHDSWMGFTDSMEPKARAKAIEALNKQVSVSGNFAQRGQHIVELVKAGATVRDDKKYKRILETPDGGFWAEKDLTKTALDFAVYLKTKRNPTSAPSISLEQARETGIQLGIDWKTSPFDAEQFRRGMVVELEHGDRGNAATNVTDDNLLLTGMITYAHLLELDTYYYLLDEMEKKGDREKKYPRKKPRVTIKTATYRDKPGFKIFGRDDLDRDFSIFVQDRKMAEAIRDEYKNAKPGYAYRIHELLVGKTPLKNPSPPDLQGLAKTMAPKWVRYGVVGVGTGYVQAEGSRHGEWSLMAWTRDLEMSRRNLPDQVKGYPVKIRDVPRAQANPAVKSKPGLRCGSKKPSARTPDADAEY